LVEIAFQICTSYHPDLLKNHLLAGWFPCVASGKRFHDNGKEQPEDSLEKDEEVWLEVSSPNVFFFFFW
jgi:hypothetical protein